MSRDDRIAQIYGYAVCLVSVVTVLITVPGIVQNSFTLASPLAAERAFERSLASFEPAPPGARPQLPDSVLRRQYETERAERPGRRALPGHAFARVRGAVAGDRGGALYRALAVIAAATGILVRAAA